MKAKLLVEKALQTWEQTRDSDKNLILAVWWLQDNEYDKNFREFFIKKAYSPETIRRIRQKFQENGQYLPSKKIEEARYNKYVGMKGYGNQVIDEIENYT